MTDSNGKNFGMVVLTGVIAGVALFTLTFAIGSAVWADKSVEAKHEAMQQVDKDYRDSLNERFVRVEANQLRMLEELAGLRVVLSRDRCVSKGEGDGS